jgi:RNA polymerase sigma factor (sigma-70 family)
MVHKYVLSSGGNTSDASDILQEAIIVLWQNVNKSDFVLSSRLSTYIMAIAKNKWRAALRKRGRLEFSDEMDHRTTRASQMEDLIRKEQVDRMQRALEKLGEPCKSILIMFYFEERKLDEIGRLLGFANTNVVKSKKYQCKNALASLLKTVPMGLAG